jgi:hypothetical protein
VTEKRKSRRSQSKYPALEPHLNTLIRQEYIDYDYLHKLSEDEKDWLNRFTEEELCANLTHNGEKFTEVENPKARSRIWKRNNDRNFCAYGNAKAGRTLVDIDPKLTDRVPYGSVVSPEDLLNRLQEEKLEEGFLDEYVQSKNGRTGSKKF